MLTEGPSVWRRWTRGFNSVIEPAFHHHGLFCATKPIVVIFVMSVIIVALSLPSLPLLFGRNPSKYASLQFDVWNTDEELRFAANSLTPPVGVPKWMDNVEPSARIMQIEVAPLEGHVMQRRALRRAAFEIPRMLESFGTDIDNTTFTLQSFCVPARTGGSKCAIYHPGLFWGCNETRFDEDATLSRVQAQPFVQAPAATDDAAGVLRTVLLKNLRGEHGINYVSADAAVLLVALRSPKTLDAAAHEKEFFQRLWRHVEAHGVTLAESGSQSAKHTYLRYRTPSSSMAEQAYLGVVYSLVFFYVYFTVARFESVKSKLGLAFGAVIIIFASTLMAIGLCQSIGLITSVTAVEVLPFLIVAIGLDNITIITDSVVSRWGVATRFQVAEGLAAAGPQLMRSLLSMEGLMIVGVYSRIAALQEFCAIVSISLLCEFALEITLYVSILSVDIRRVELADFFAVNVGTDRAPVVSRPNAPERGSGSSLRSRDGSVHGFNVGVPFILSVITTVILALLGGVSNVADSAYAHASIPSLLVDWRYAFGALGTAESVRPTLLFLPPMVAVLAPDRSPGSLADELPLVWVPSYLDGPQSQWATGVAVLLVLSVMALTGCWYFQLPARLNAWVFGLYGTGAAAFNAFGEAQNCELTTFLGHTQEIECVAVVASGECKNPLFATACLGGEIRIWDPETARCVEILASSGNPEVSVEFSDTDAVAPWCLAAHGTFVVAGYASGVVRVWDMSTRRVVALPPSGPLPGEGEPNEQDGGGITAVAFFEDTLVTASSTGVLQQWHFHYAPRSACGGYNVAQDKPYIPRALSRHKNLGGSDSDTAVCSRCGSHEVLPGRQLVRSGVPFMGTEHCRQPNSPKFTLGDEGEGGTNSPDAAPAWDVPESTVLTFHRVYSKAVHKNSITSLMASGNLLVSTSRDKLVKLFSPELKCVRTFFGHESEVTCVGGLGTSAIVSGSRDHSVRVWRVADGSCENVLTGHTDSIMSVCLSKARAVSCSEDDTIRIWSRATGRCTQVIRDSTMQVVLHPSSVLLTASDGGLTAWNLLGHVERLRTVALSDEHDDTAESDVAGPMATRHLAIHNDTVICDFGCHVKAIKLPFPETIGPKSKEP